MTEQPIRIGTRGSVLAMVQAGLVADALRGIGQAVELVHIETDGDRRAPDTSWGEGVFVTAIEQALRDGRVDVAVHSAKDLPTDTTTDLVIAAYLPREDPSDALVLRTDADVSADALADLPVGARVGTDSPRRTGFLRSRRPDLDVRPLHGNVDTRLRRLDAGEADALVLASAGLIRLGRADRITQRLPIDVVPPAPGQGAIAVQVRSADSGCAALAAQIDDEPTRQAVETERTFLNATGGGCRAPIGALATVRDGRMSMLFGFASVDGSNSAFETVSGSVGDASALAVEAAATLVRRRSAIAGGRRVLVARTEAEATSLTTALAGAGMSAVVVPAIEINPTTSTELAQAVAHLDDYDWTVVTSANGARSVLAAAAHIAADMDATRWAAVGHASALVLRKAGIEDVWIPDQSNAAALADELPLAPGMKVLLARGSMADDELPDRLFARGAAVQAVVAYETTEAPEASRLLLRAAFEDGPISAVIFASPSQVRGVLGLADSAQAEMIRSLPALCIGPRTAAAARDAGFADVHESAIQSAAALAELAAAVRL